MLTLRRWWFQHRFQAVLIMLILGAAWGFRQTQAAAFFEVYRWLTQPFTASPTQTERIAIAGLEELQIRLTELEAQNQKLETLLKYVSAYPKKGVIAPIIGRSADHWWQQVTLGRGSQNGIQVGHIAAGPGGLIGRVIQVTPHTSRVLLVSDPSSYVGVVLSRSRFPGVLQGQGNNQAVMEFFNKEPDVRRGDVVSTSGFSQLFPPGIPVGRVVAIDLRKSPAPEVVIELTAPFDFLDTAIVYPYQPISDQQQESRNR
jgi:rod shape-determining protein MreC